jgi:gas vesicle protein
MTIDGMEQMGKERDKKLGSNVAYLVAGLGIGAALGILFAPKSGEETREWIGTQCDKGVAFVDTTIQDTRRHSADLIDRAKQQVNEAMGAGRKAFKKAKAVAS